MPDPQHQTHIKYSYANYLSWQDDKRWEIIDGHAYAMSPAPTRYHQKIIAQLMGILVNFLKEKPCEVYCVPFDVRFIDHPEETNEEIKNVVQPDISVICDPAKLDDKGCLGAPDWIIEILSPSTTARDVKDKFYLYEKYGVKEYWTMDQYNKLVSVYKLGSDGLYGKADRYVADDKIKSGILNELTLDLAEVYTE